ncbi:hypothetical protein BC629DRAFT_1056474 [Irpex lacteus]|nr:hypothetical protein BC629DRAFT_1056474 [Irpex lacteus]
MVGTGIADKWNKHFYDKMDEKHASSTVPLPGEYIVVERNYYILGDRLQKDPEIREELKAELTSEPHKKYCAVVYKFLETLNDRDRTWHACLMLILCDPGNKADRFIPKDLFGQGSSWLSESKWIAVPACLRTRRDKMAGKTGRMSPGTLEELFRRSISPSPCPCKGGKTICEFKGDPEISKYGDISEKDETGFNLNTDSEPNKESDKHRFRHLWPQLSFDLNAEQTVDSGKDFLEKQSSILRAFDRRNVNIAPCISGFLAHSQPDISYQKPDKLSIEYMRYLRHYIKDGEMHLIVISSERLENRPYTVYFIRNFNPPSSKPSLRTILHFLSSPLLTPVEKEGEIKCLADFMERQATCL